MITIKTSDLKKVIQAAKNIKPNNILPIYAYVKLVCKGDVCTFYKSNGHSFMVYGVDANFKKDTELLVDEKILSAAVLFTQSKEIVISIKGKDVIIDDGKKELYCQINTDPYPAIQDLSNVEKVFIDTETLSSLFLAKLHTAHPSDKTIRAWNTFVQLRVKGKKSYIVGANQITSYFKVFERELPEMSLDADVVSVIGKYSSLNYFTSGNYDCFDTGDIIYGFIKTESVAPDLPSIFERFKTETMYALNKKEVVSYCESVIQINDTSVPPDVLISDKSGNQVELSYESMSGNRSAKEPVDASKKTGKIEDFRFQPQAMINSLSCLYGEDIMFGFFSHNCILSTKEDENTFTSVMELAKL